MESYQETVLSAIKLSFFLTDSDLGEIPAGDHLLFFLVSYLESLLIAACYGKSQSHGFKT